MQQISTNDRQNQQLVAPKKVFIQRNYSEGTHIKFDSKLPPELNGIVSPEDFEKFIKELNEIYEKSESMNARTFCESCFACLTAYSLYLCIETNQEKYMKEAVARIERQNETWRHQGIRVLNPIDRGFRVIEIQHND